jgi:hypothetical protein
VTLSDTKTTVRVNRPFLFCCLKVVEESPLHVVTMPIRTDAYDPDSSPPTGLYVLLRVSHTPKYPEEVPQVSIL